MSKFAATGLLDQPTRTALLSLQKQIDALGSSGRRNLLDNGAMDVCQRATSSSGVTAGGFTCVDRWGHTLGTLGTWTDSQDTSVPTGEGFTKSLKVLCTTADASPAAGDYNLITLSLEGQDVQHLAYGSSQAKTVALSFWAKSNKTGTYVVELRLNGGTAFVGNSYTVNTADTWERKTLTLPGNTATAITNDSSGALALWFWLGAGSTYSGGAALGTTWHATNNLRAVGQVNLAAATNNYWQVTGVQLEVGDGSTDYEFAAYTDELRRCQRFYRVPSAREWRGQFYSTTSCKLICSFPPMRATPTVTVASSPYTNWINNVGIGNKTPTSVTSTSSDASSADVIFAGAAATTALSMAHGDPGSAFKIELKADI